MGWGLCDCDCGCDVGWCRGARLEKGARVGTGRLTRACAGSLALENAYTALRYVLYLDGGYDSVGDDGRVPYNVGTQLADALVPYVGTTS